MWGHMDETESNEPDPHFFSGTTKIADADGIRPRYRSSVFRMRILQIIFLHLILWYFDQSWIPILIIVILVIAYIFEGPVLEHFLNRKRTELTRPKFGVFYWLNRRPDRANWLVTILSFGALSFLYLSILISHDWNWWQTGLVSVLAVLTAQYVGTRLQLLFWHSLLAGKMKIVALRRNEERSGYIARNVIHPYLGALGYPIYITDDHMLKNGSHFWETTDLMGGLQTSINYGDPEWLELVEYELSQADAAVFNWMTPPSEPMIDELKAAMGRLPTDRIFLIVNAQSLWVAKDVLRRLGLNIQPIIFESNRNLVNQLHASFRSVSSFNRPALSEI